MIYIHKHVCKAEAKDDMEYPGLIGMDLQCTPYGVQSRKFPVNWILWTS
jgi:hypothetical protein